MAKRNKLPKLAEIRDAVARLAKARAALKAAKLARMENAKTVGACDGIGAEGGPCYARDYELCDVCVAKVPFNEAYWKASSEAGVALRVVLSLGRRLNQ